MGGRLATETPSTTTATTHRTRTSGSTSNLAHSRIHAINANHSLSNQIVSNTNRPRASSSHQRSHRNHQHSAHSLQTRRPRTVSTNIDPSSNNAFNLNLLRYVGLNHDSDDPSSEDESPHLNHRRFQHLLFAIRDLPCPVCNKTIPSDSLDKHILHCLSKPRIDYNEDTLAEDKGECSICLDDLITGQKIARLPCLCIYHKSCIDNWFKINRTCPEHPGDQI